MTLAMVRAEPDAWWISLVEVGDGPICSYGAEPDGDLESCAEPCYPVVSVPVHQEGGVFIVGGLNEAILNITTNYAVIYRLAGFDPWELNGEQARGIRPRLDEIIGCLGANRYLPDYYAPTPGNAGYALDVLRDWAMMHPDAIFRVEMQ